MDAVAVAVLRWMMTGLDRYPARSEIRESMATAAKKLHCTEATVRARTRRLFESGLLKGWLVFVNPISVAQRVAVIRLDVLPPSARDDVIRKFKLIEGVWLITKNYDSALGISTYYPDGVALKKKVELMARIANSEHVTFGEIPFPPCSYAFKHVDLVILRCVQESPSLSYSGIAKQVHLSSKTVRRRLNGMIRERAVFATLDFDFGKSKRDPGRESTCHLP
ncbi:MAG: AsnC family transcriptional regulator [Thaumarchaeota archaeon]|nr:AsnC family transcriptional regulator [Nitrososphaerota archaeon]